MEELSANATAKFITNSKIQIYIQLKKLFFIFMSKLYE